MENFLEHKSCSFSNLYHNKYDASHFSSSFYNKQKYSPVSPMPRRILLGRHRTLATVVRGAQDPEHSYYDYMVL